MFRSLLFQILLGFLIAMALLFITISPYARRIRERVHVWKLRRLAGRLQAVMVAATAIASPDRPGGVFRVGSFFLDPGNVAAGGSEKETVAIQGVTADDIAWVSPRTSPAAGIVIGFVRTSANQIEFSIENNSAGALDLANLQWNYCIIRGVSGPIR